MSNKRWVVRECDIHGLISVDEVDLTTCPAPSISELGPCGHELSEKFRVMRVVEPPQTLSPSEVELLLWLREKGGTIDDPDAGIVMLIACQTRLISTAGTILRQLRRKKIVDYVAKQGVGTSSLRALVNLDELLAPILESSQD